MDFPFEAIARVVVADSKTAYVLLDLPEIEDIMPETRTKVLKDGTTRDVKRPQAERLKSYANLVCGLAFLIARTAFCTGPTLNDVHIAAYTQRRQKRTGEVQDDFVYEVAISRGVSAALEHAKVDPVTEMLALKSRMKQSASGDLTKIAPPTWMDAGK
jgi:hypothetical protein